MLNITLWLSNNNTNGDGRMFGLLQPTGGLKGQVCSLSYELAAPGIDQVSLKGPKVNSRIWLHTVDDSTINIVLFIIIIITIVHSQLSLQGRKH